MDGLVINLLLCLAVIAGLVISAIIDVRALYPTAALYVIQFFEFCCSNTR